MKLISCYIENFGTLSQFTYHFNEGLNIISEDNGWGKSTFAAFIKAMFYGLEYNVRSKNLYERTKYMPWKGGQFGGNLIFEIDGKQYRIERYFGIKEKEDTFAIYDLAKNSKCDVYHENIGEEIWGIDRTSFERSVFISLQNYGQTELLTDIISSKLSDVEERGDDLDKFDNAFKLLDQKATELRAKKGNKGKISQLEELLVHKKQAFTECEMKLIEIQNHNQEITNLKSELNEYQKRISEISNDIRLADKNEKMKIYQGLVNEVKDAKADVEELEGFFKGNIPTPSDIELQEKLAMDIRQYKNYLTNHSISNDERQEMKELNSYFQDKIPDNSEMEECRSAISKLQNIQIKNDGYKLSVQENERLEQLNQIYQKTQINGNKIDNLLDQYAHVNEIALNIAGKKKELELLQQYKEPVKSGNNRMFTFIGGGIIAFGLIVSIFYLVPGILLSFAGLCLLVGSILTGISRKTKSREDNSVSPIVNLQEEIRQLNEEKNGLEQSYVTLIEKVKPEVTNYNVPNLLNEIKYEIAALHDLTSKKIQYEELINKNNLEEQALKLQIESFLELFEKTISTDDYLQVLRKIESRKNRMEILSGKLKEYDEISNELNHKMQIVNPFLELYFEYPQDTPYEAVKMIGEKRNRLIQMDNIYNKRVDAKEKFERQYEISDLDNSNISGKNLEELQADQENYNNKVADIREKIANRQKQIDDLSVIADKKEDIESEMAAIKEEMDTLAYRNDILIKTMNCLMKAKEELASRYMGDMEEAFQNYLHKIGASKAQDIKLDITLNAKIESAGTWHEKGYFSSGQQDLVNVCIRLALVEAIFKDMVNPIIVLDDPFTNFDEDKLKQALRLIHNISERYQIIYFTCHPSRQVISS